MAKDEGKRGEKVAVAVKAIEELPGVGPATAEKLKEAGFTDLMGLAVASPRDRGRDPGASQVRCQVDDLLEGTG